jgi:hypothetical protein
VEGDVVGRSEAGEDGEEAEANIATAKLDGEERSWRGSRSRFGERGEANTGLIEKVLKTN